LECLNYASCWDVLTMGFVGMS